MKKSTALFVLALPLWASEPLTDYWRAVAYRYAAEAQFERSLTPQQRELREAAAKAEAGIQAAEKAVAATCKPDEELDRTGTEPTCKTKAKK